MKIGVLSTKKSRSRKQALTLQQTALSVMEALQTLPITILQMPSKSVKQQDPQAAGLEEGQGDDDDDDDEQEQHGDGDDDEQQQPRQQAAPRRAEAARSPDTPSPPPPPRQVYQMEFMITPKKAAVAS